MKKVEKSTTVDLALVLGYIATKDLATTENKVGVLTKLGYSNNDMAKICGTGHAVIKTVKSRVKKGGK